MAGSSKDAGMSYRRRRQFIGHIVRPFLFVSYCWNVHETLDAWPYKEETQSTRRQKRFSEFLCGKDSAKQVRANKKA
jgi:hypothetical protein